MTTTQRDTNYCIDTALRLADLVSPNDAPTQLAPPMRRPINYVDELRTRTNP